MLEKQKDIDAVSISTPDHNHAIIAMTAMQLGKHVYVQKPMGHTVEETRLMHKTAKKLNLITQVGNQGHAAEGARLTCEWIWDNAIAALMSEEDKILEYDEKTGKFTNSPEANDLFTKEYRKGWSL